MTSLYQTIMLILIIAAVAMAGFGLLSMTPGTAGLHYTGLAILLARPV